MSGDQSKSHKPAAGGAAAPASGARDRAAAKHDGGSERPATVESVAMKGVSSKGGGGKTAPPAEVVVIQETATAAAPAAKPISDVNWSSPRYLWQGPTILLSVILIAWGLYVGAKPAAPNDFEGALAQIEQWIEASELDRASAQLRVVIEPNLAMATEGQKARFEAAVADYLFLTTQARELSDPEVLRRVATHYATAVDMGLAISAARLERWAEALLATGQIKQAQRRLAELDRRRAAEKDPAIVESLAATRTRVFRRMIETWLEQPEYDYEGLMGLLADFRLDRGISAADEVWAIARQTELRLHAGLARQAVDLLLVEMRRLENRSLPGEAAAGAIGELYTLLGRAYVELGDYTRAKAHLEHALTLFTGPESARGDALAMLGQIALSTGQPDAAMEHFQLVVRDFITTPSYLPGLLGRAEVFSILGDHEASMSDFRMLTDALETSKAWRNAGTERTGVTPSRVAEGLCDRHDAAVALAQLHRALDYVELAEALFDREEVPADVLFRLAATNRQIADDLLAQERTSSQGASDAHNVAEADPAVRREANTRYERAADDFLRHSNADLSDLGSADNEAATSLWLAADSYDLGGRQDRAVEFFTKYLDMQPIDDPRRAQTLFRLARACQASGDVDSAIRHYEQLVADRSRSSFAAQAYVPLARSYVTNNRTAEARQLLQQVLTGNRLLQPDAADYRDALIELGRIEYRADAHTPAIEAFEEFLQRYPDDPRAMEVRYLLADSYRAGALAIVDRVEQDAGMSPSEAGRLNAISNEHLTIAQDLFAQVSEAAIPTGSGRMTVFQQDMIRRAALYRADCAFHLAQFEQAINLYDHAARQYSDHQSSMYALIQIVNAYTALGDTERAAAAHHRALVRLKQLPDDAFRTADVLMDRAAWERWLENNPVNPSRSAAASAPTE